MRKLIVFLFFWIGISTSAWAFTLSKFDLPESFIADPQDGAYYVSNMNGSPTEKDGNGYISKIGASGGIVIQKFIGGKPDEAVLNAPKGLALIGKEIFVTDIDTVKVFDKETRKEVAIVDLSKQNAKFLNDITPDADGNLYVSDMDTNRIFRISPRKNYEVKIFKDSPLLGHPNGVVVNPKSRNLMVVTWESGQILEIDSAGGIHCLKRGLTRLDGVDYDEEGNLYVSSFEKGEIYKISRMGRGTLSTFLSGLTTPADISCDRRRKELLIPSMKAGAVTTVHLPKK
ncbi:MAG: SMP-30/gluconolactonase/LRE family protein [Candidatus Omnitrophica bacterium]|nr:SMP-30/gluconolactonase/LRE family protein [Candidatus Omnitrophota bacterium]